jgi:hypothetical protein
MRMLVNKRDYRFSYHFAVFIGVISQLLWGPECLMP